MAGVYSGIDRAFFRDGNMGDIVRFRKPKPGEKHRGKGLCRDGFHKWMIDQKQQFDVKKGRLVTLYRCQRCGITRTDAL